MRTFNPLGGCNSQQARYSNALLPNPLFENEDENEF